MRYRFPVINVLSIVMSVLVLCSCSDAGSEQSSNNSQINPTNQTQSSPAPTSMTVVPTTTVPNENHLYIGDWYINSADGACQSAFSFELDSAIFKFQNGKRFIRGNYSLSSTPTPDQYHIDFTVLDDNGELACNEDMLGFVLRANDGLSQIAVGSSQNNLFLFYGKPTALLTTLARVEPGSFEFGDPTMQSNSSDTMPVEGSSDSRMCLVGNWQLDNAWFLSELRRTNVSPDIEVVELSGSASFVLSADQTGLINFSSLSVLYRSKVDGTSTKVGVAGGGEFQWAADEQRFNASGTDVALQISASITVAGIEVEIPFEDNTIRAEDFIGTPAGTAYSCNRESMLLRPEDPAALSIRYLRI